MKNRFIFDLDDTLINTQYHYSQVLIKFVQFVYENLGRRAPGVTEILDLQYKIDTEAIDKKDFAMERFPTSLADTFEALAKEMKKPQGQIDYGRRHSYNLGMEVFDPDYWTDDLVTGARVTLDFLQNIDDELFLLTTGDSIAQRKKIEHYGLEQWFEDRIGIVPKEKSVAMENFSAGMDRDRIWMVGNSKRSDIAPALQCGIGAIYIPAKTWKYDDYDLSTLDTTRLTTLDSIAEIIPLHATQFSKQ